MKMLFIFLIFIMFLLPRQTHDLFELDTFFLQILINAMQANCSQSHSFPVCGTKELG